MNLYWTAEAQQRLQDLKAYIADDSAELAEQTIIRLVGRVEQLLEFPEIGHHLNDYPHAELREILERPYRIIYQITNEQIEIMTVLHYRQLIPKHIGKS